MQEWNLRRLERINDRKSQPTLKAMEAFVAIV